MKATFKHEAERQLYAEIKDLVLKVEREGRDRLGDLELRLIKENIVLLEYLDTVYFLGVD